MQVRAARSTTLSCTVAGWTQQGGRVWEINQLADVDAEILGVSGQMLVAAIEYGYDDGGEISKIELKRPDAFLPDPKEVEKAAGKPEKDKKAAKAKTAKAGKRKKAGGKAAKQGGGNAADGAWELAKNSDGSYTVGNRKK